jgi:lipopolysaccharide export system permease protein
MKILTRYVILEMAKVFLVTLSSMTALMLIVGVVQEAIRENLTPFTILQLIPFVLPNALCFAIPGTALFSTCMVLGRMSASNEVIAIKAMGISPMAVVWPVLLMAFVMSILTVYLNDLAVSWGRQGVYRVVLNSVEKTIYAVLNTQRSYQNGRISIFVDRVEGNELVNPAVHFYKDQGELQFTAESARLSVNPETRELVFTVRNAMGLSDEGTFNIVMPDGDLTIPLQDATRNENRDESPSNLPLRVMRQEVLQQTAMNALENRKLAMQATFQMLGGDFVSLTHPRWSAQLQILGMGQERVYRLQTEPWRRWANGFSCLCFVLVGAPLAILLRRSDFWSTFGLCFIPILLVYYPLLMYGVGRAKSGDLWPPIVWLGNLVLLALGWLLLRLITRN